MTNVEKRLIPQYLYSLVAGLRVDFRIRQIVLQL
jgi:hypothetical protein